MEKIALKCTRSICKYNNKTELELKKIKYGIEILLINISKFLIIMSISYFLNIIPLTLTIMTSFGMVRRSSFGLHAKSNLVCTIVSTSAFIGGVYVSKYYPLESKMIIPIFLILIGLFIQYSPSDTEERPLIGKKHRSKLRRSTVITVLILFITTIIINNKTISTLITLGVTMQCISILPISYKVLNRRYNNYEQYK